MDNLSKITEKLTPSKLIPTIFVGHGNPMNAITENDITKNWDSLSTLIDKDIQAVIVISAHWMTNGVKITSAAKQPIIYDFYGFPDELYNVKYDAIGDPQIGSIIIDQIKDYEAKLDNSWGLDHGTWSVLKHVIPNPKIPILQISLDRNQSIEDMFDMFKDLKDLRNKGVMFIGSGNIVHSLRYMNFDNEVYDWAEEFDYLVKERIDDRNFSTLINPYKMSKASILAVPTDEHYRPMMAVLSLLYPNEEIRYFNDFFDMGSVGMRSFVSYM